MHGYKREFVIADATRSRRWYQDSLYCVDVNILHCRRMAIDQLLGGDACSTTKRHKHALDAG